MKLYSLNTAAMVLLVLGVTGMIVPTAAVPGGVGSSSVEAGSDRVWDDPAIVLQPSDGPNGEYASIGPDGNLSVDLSDLNADSVTRIDAVFTIANTEDTPRRVWVSHDGGDDVQFSLESGRSLDDAADPVELGSDDVRTVSLVVDTQGRGAGETIMTSLTLHAERATNATPTPTPGQPTPGTATPTATPTNETPTATPEPNGTDTPTTPAPTPDDEEGVEIEFDVGTGDGEPDPGEEVVDVREMNVTELEDEDQTVGPRAVINHSRRRTVEIGREDREDDLRLKAYGANAIAEVDEPVNLSGTRSLIGQANGIDRERRIVKLVDVTVPEERREEPATVRIRVKRSKFGDTHPGNATIAHRTNRGWQLLDTRVVAEDDRTVTLAARTSGFSPFAVFADNEVEYEWTLPDGTSLSGKQIRSQFDAPGLYNVSLSVTDSFGRSDTARHRILVNDRPTVEIEGLENATVGEPVTLRANVTNEVGNTSVAWVFSDGTTAVGDTVEHTFGSDESVVRVTVEDEFGASGTDERSVTAGSDVRADVPVIGVVQFNLGLENRIALVGFGAVVLAVLLRWLAVRRLEIAGGRRRRSGRSG